MLGAIIGDIIGSPYEFKSFKSTDFPLFGEGCKTTDDTICTAAVAAKLVRGGSYEENFVRLGNRYINKGWGLRFMEWLENPERTPYASLGNGAAMRVSPIGWWFDTLDQVLAEAKLSCDCTHNHPDSYAAAQAISGSIFKLRTGSSKEEVRSWLTETFNYDLSRTIESIRPSYKFEVSCARSVPEAIIAFMEGNSFEEVARLAVSLGGDSDTQAAIACSLAEAFYEIPINILIEASVFIEPDIIDIWTEYAHAVTQRRQ
jgi:ADP-ribosylglycohydrolase